MFTLKHFIWLGLFAVIIPVLLVLLKKLNVSHKAVARAVLVLSIVCRIIHVCCNMVPASNGVGMILDEDNLPFHLCSIQLYLYIAINLIKNEKILDVIKSFVVPSAAIGASLALFIPTGGVEFDSLKVWQYMLAHALFVFYGMYLMLNEKVELGLRAYARNLGFLGAFAVVAFVANSFLQEYNTNFCYLVRPPMEGLPILNLNNGWYAYIVTIIIIALVLVFVVQSPFIIKDIINKIKNRKKQA